MKGDIKERGRESGERRGKEEEREESVACGLTILKWSGAESANMWLPQQPQVLDSPASASQPQRLG